MDLRHENVTYMYVCMYVAIYITVLNVVLFMYVPVYRLEMVFNRLLFDLEALHKYVPTVCMLTDYC